MNPALGRNFEAMDPLEWLARISDHIPDPGQHRTIFYGEYSSRANQHSISRILEHLGLRSPELDRPPPAREIREITRVAEAGEGWGVEASASKGVVCTLRRPRPPGQLP